MVPTRKEFDELTIFIKSLTTLRRFRYGFHTTISSLHRWNCRRRDLYLYLGNSILVPRYPGTVLDFTNVLQALGRYVHNEGCAYRGTRADVFQLKDACEVFWLYPGTG